MILLLLSFVYKNIGSIVTYLEIFLKNFFLNLPLFLLSVLVVFYLGSILK